MAEISAPFVWFRGGGRRYSALPVTEDNGKTFKARFAGIPGYYVVTLHRPGKDAITARQGGNENLALEPGDEVIITVTESADG